MTGRIRLLDFDLSAAKDPICLAPHAETIGTNAAWATFSTDRRYRYLLGRRWDPNPETALLAVIMLNPSIAGIEDDPTVRKVIGFAKRLGFGGITVANLFAYIATDPRDLAKAESAIGPGNDVAIRLCLHRGNVTQRMAAWGNLSGKLRKQAVLRPLAVTFGANSCWGTTKSGDPRHPLMLAYATPWQPFELVR